MNSNFSGFVIYIKGSIYLVLCNLHDWKFTHSAVETSVGKWFRVFYELSGGFM